MKNYYKKLTRLFITAVFLIGFADLSFGQTVIISEVTDPGNTANAKFVEIYNATSSSVNISGWQIRRYANGGTTPTNATIPTTTNLASGDTYVIAYNTSDFNTAYGFETLKNNTTKSNYSKKGFAKKFDDFWNYSYRNSFSGKYTVF